MTWLAEIRWEFLPAFCAILGGAWILRNWRMGRVSALLFVSWIVGTAYVLVTKDYTPWLFSACVDFGVAWAILRDPAGRWQSAIGWTLIAQIVIHFVFGMMQVRGQQPDHQAYWHVLTALAWAQIGLVGVWEIGGGNRAFHRRLRGRPRLHLSPGMGGMEP